MVEPYRNTFEGLSNAAKIFATAHSYAHRIQLDFDALTIIFERFDAMKKMSALSFARVYINIGQVTLDVSIRHAKFASEPLLEEWCNKCVFAMVVNL